MTASNHHHDSAPWARFVLVVALAATALFANVLTLETIGTSIVAMLYALCLVLMLAAGFRSVAGSSPGGKMPGSPQPRPEPAWEVHTTFTDPLFQGPAVFCVFVLALDLVSDLRAEPPTSQQALGFLIAMSFLAVVLLLEPLWRARHEADTSGRSPGQIQAEPHRKEATADPWFSIPHVALGFIIFTRLGVLQIEEDPTSVATWALLLIPPGLGAYTALSGALRRPRRARG